MFPFDDVIMLQTIGNERAPTMGDRGKMIYTEATLLEVQRIASIGESTRNGESDDSIEYILNCKRLVGLVEVHWKRTVMSVTARYKTNSLPGTISIIINKTLIELDAGCICYNRHLHTGYKQPVSVKTILFIFKWSYAPLQLENLLSKLH